jgi:hypothetical protein
MLMASKRKRRDDILDLIDLSDLYASFNPRSAAILATESLLSSSKGRAAFGLGPTPDFATFLSYLQCDVEALTSKVWKTYISESERKIRDSWKRFCRISILSDAVSKDGHLSYLVPSSREACIETAARDHIVHLEVITLSEEQEAPGTSVVGQILNTGGESWKRWRNRLSNLSSKYLRKALPSGSTACGLSFASAGPLLQY